MKDGANITLSTLHTTVHLGAHADGPNHYGADARSIDQQPLELYIGRCQVIGVDVPRRTRIVPEMIKGDIDAPRILLRTGTFLDPNKWQEDFAAIAPLLVERLAGQGVKLVGIDAPSVDLFDSKDLPAHKAFLKHDLAILEGLVLRDVPDGIYELIALPLKLVGFDGSPVRAILRDI
jgi:arylformamidase